MSEYPTANIKQAQPLLLPEQQPPMLLLTGDELHVSNEGVARSHYTLCIPSQTNQSQEKGSSTKKRATSASSSSSTWTIEEDYCLEESFKTFVLRERNLFGSTTSATTRLEIQEMDTREVGTGGCTWEASLGMALYFAAHPEQLRGRVLELGSGVGLGGIMVHHVTHGQNEMVLTDGNDQILEQCQANIDRRQNNDESNTQNSNNEANDKLRVQKVDWNDALLHGQPCSNDTSDQHQKYNTVLACDCAYRKGDVPALAATLKSMLLLPTNENENSESDNKMHLFGPYNRGAYLSLIEFLEQDESLDVQSEWVELNRYRLAVHDDDHQSAQRQQDARTTGDSKSLRQDATSVSQHPYNGHHPAHNNAYNQTDQQLEEELREASQSRTKFLHVSASFRKEKGKDTQTVSNTPLSDID